MRDGDDVHRHQHGAAGVFDPSSSRERAAGFVAPRSRSSFTVGYIPVARCGAPHLRPVSRLSVKVRTRGSEKPKFLETSNRRGRHVPKTALTLLALFLVLPAIAAEVGGVKLDDKVSLGGQDLVLNGAGIRTQVFLKIYVAGLYVPAKSGDVAAILGKGPRRIQMNLLRDLSGDQLVGALNDGLKDNNTEAEMAAVKVQADQMTAIMKKFRRGEGRQCRGTRFRRRHDPISLNGAPKGSIAGEAFNKALTQGLARRQARAADL